ncbi:extracellular solute-binding protein [Tuberibacillus sp. Marseille-P3662]|uniref:extracellular solute-binding protein n=1 Tax=Tuberibacillus sp. Marseille-P3662 TaxID=1965358 RepID=UPI000A1CBE47|nr:extracellular solute-binding protein [Tuberibacillus sp. Marseille-P3662]
MKKLATFLAICSLLLITACSGGSDKTSSSDNGGASHGDKKVLDFWYIETGAEEQVILDAIDRFEKDNPEFKVNAVHTANDSYKQKLSVAMSGGSPPDIFDSWGGGWLKHFVEQGQVLDVTDQIDKTRYLEFALKNAAFDEKQYGVPLGLSLDLVFYNKDIFNKYDLTPPKTYEEWVDIVKTLRENDIIPMALANKTKWPGAYYLMNFADRIAGYQLFESALNREGKGFDNQAYVQAGKYIQELVKMDAFNEGFNGVPYDAGRSRQLMYTGQAAMQDITIAFLNNVRDEAPQFEKKLGVFKFPTVAKGKGDPSNVGGATSPVWSVSADTQYPDAAVKLIKELTSSQTAQAYVKKTGSLTPVKGVEPEDPFVKKFYKIANEANHIQMPYDQTLPPELAEVHKDTTQAIFGLEITPKEAADKMEAKAQDILE